MLGPGAIFAILAIVAVFATYAILTISATVAIVAKFASLSRLRKSRDCEGKRKQLVMSNAESDLSNKRPHSQTSDNVEVYFDANASLLTLCMQLHEAKKPRLAIANSTCP